MTYKLKFDKRALKEWEKLGYPVKTQFKKKLEERLENPRVPSAKLSGHADRYKIKLRSAGYRLVYQVFDEEIVVTVIAIGKRENSDVYSLADNR
ncbi:type II toxin-antitoxin system RelE/ParE family toxin [Shewanella avicenniae]|uniref:Type II toxin-antitoxin system RelE/ParE family toxin n=1 Tax=Shewanella avicenniae TaxID=2814294 RepID=A0ABX7QP54_9GAMM|nr:type II toxin-antitoxin system RelE/ParE family toxin [Shewanella avicenniae]QSX32496.1 type II toxin-antitoxin system RelE/ParE family toxin [Shewanella avicenniae]